MWAVPALTTNFQSVLSWRKPYPFSQGSCQLSGSWNLSIFDSSVRNRHLYSKAACSCHSHSSRAMRLLFPRGLFLFSTLLRKKTCFPGLTLSLKNYSNPRMLLLVLEELTPSIACSAGQCRCGCKKNSETVALPAKHFHVYEELKRIWRTCSKMVALGSVCHLCLVYDVLLPVKPVPLHKLAAGRS